MRRFSSRFTRGLSSTPRTSVKIAAFAPMPSASVKITMVASPLLRISEWNATFRSRKNDMILLLAASISTPGANRKTHIVNHLPWAASTGMLVFGCQCPNSDTDSVVESRDTWRVVQKRRFALTYRLPDRLLPPSIFDDRADPPGPVRWPVDV